VVSGGGHSRSTGRVNAILARYWPSGALDAAIALAAAASTTRGRPGWCQRPAPARLERGLALLVRRVREPAGQRRFGGFGEDRARTHVLDVGVASGVSNPARQLVENFMMVRWP
jgi:hypothetical protein